MVQIGLNLEILTQQDHQMVVQVLILQLYHMEETLLVLEMKLKVGMEVHGLKLQIYLQQEEVVVQLVLVVLQHYLLEEHQSHKQD